MNQNRLYRLLMAGAIAVVLLNTWMAHRALSTMFEAQRWQAHTLEVLSQTETMVAQLRTAESAARGYILTGSSTFADQYDAASHGLFDRIDAVQRMTVDNDSQQQRLAYLRARVIAKMTALDTGMAVRRGHTTGAIDPSLLGPVLNDTPDRAQSVQYAVTQIENEEKRLLTDRAAETLAARRQVWAAGAIASVLDILLVIAAFQLLIRADRDRGKLAERAEEIVTLNSELTSLNTDLEQRVDQRTRELAVSNQELEAFSYSVSHDLRAPLRTIDGFSLALEEDFADKLDDSGRDYIQRVRNGVQRMGQLIDALLQLSRVSRSDLQRERIDMAQLATLVFEELAHSDPSIKTTFLAQPGTLANADPRLVRIALENLIGNAWKFTSRTPEGRIEFGSMPRGEETVYFVRDNGAGFDMKYVDRLFTAFQRLHGDRDFKGSGIGLATVSRIVLRHHGAIWAESEIGNGATFFFTLGS